MCFAGIDLGGTNIKAGLLRGDMSVICKTSRPTLAGRRPVEIIRDMADSIRKLAEDNGIQLNDIKGVGVGIPGVPNNGTVISHNLYWFNVPLAKLLEEYLGLPVFIDNDAAAAALYEYHFGVLAGCRVGVIITLGTGVGGRIIIDGKPFSGAHGLGSEIGHMSIVPDGIQCTCGNKGCLEVYASASALVRCGRRCVLERPESMLHHITGGDYLKVTPQNIFECARRGDYIALGLIDDYTEYLAMGIGTLENLIDPDVIAIGGGLSGEGDFLLDRIRRAAAGKGIFEGCKYADIVIARSGNDAGVTGAAMLAMS